ncbi:hypothetical protein CXB51_018807 [Gossypium anomalum]|uniref:RNase H type-1 domain-containing protein n=1 Tax=Gossypium anomalum TaxID=47600 RepID=A0A8J6CUE7_9ROSI|nr:hypothetical protein CXB51_018807 [Gossypium anomalum]
MIPLKFHTRFLLNLSSSERRKDIRFDSTSPDSYRNDPFLPNQKSSLVIDDGGFNLRRYLFDPIGRASQIVPSSCKGVRCFICLSRVFSGFCPALFKPRVAEAVSVREALSWLKVEGFDRVVVEMD